ncbi:hypothetical protein POM88_045986 [Heracleum sosnowskyi]|uniref:DUF4371 domain-containing protein n=1 Tax=Heracleum sosnowskyi TaxID=360622 RepID=A0AAD8H8H3_9APIA|nr:hypothetical protein POM88_045986 [Heracleum sosnowskyi]
MDKFVIRTKRVRTDNQQSQETNQARSEFIQNEQRTTTSAPVQEQISVDNNDIFEQIIADPGSILYGIKNSNACWNILKKKMLHCVCVVIFLTLNLVIIDLSMIRLLVKVSKTGKRKTDLRNTLEKHNNSHSKCLKACEDLLKRKQHIDIMIAGISTQAKADYRIRLNATVECVRMLLMHALPFRGHDESETSKNKGFFLALFNFLCKHNEEISSVSLKNAPENNILISPTIQKDICNCASFLTTRAIIQDINDGFFSLLVDEARDSAIKEQMAVGLRYVNKEGIIIERILGIVHVQDTTSQRLQEVRENGWNNLLTDIGQFYEMNEIDIPQMDEFFVPRGRSRRNTEKHTNFHHFQIISNEEIMERFQKMKKRRMLL